MGKYSVDFTFTPFYESFSETEEGSNNTLETANNAETETIYSGLLTETDKVDIFKYSFDKKMQCLRFWRHLIWTV